MYNANTPRLCIERLEAKLATVNTHLERDDLSRDALAILRLRRHTIKLHIATYTSILRKQKGTDAAAKSKETGVVWGGPVRHGKGP